MASNFKAYAKSAKERAELKTRFEKNQEAVRAVFNSKPFQCLGAFLIFAVISTHYLPAHRCLSLRSFLNPASPSACRIVLRTVPQNFVVNAAQAQLNGQLTDTNGSATQTSVVLNALDTLFTCAFTVELCINAYAHWLRPFVSNRFNLVDTTIIILSLIALGPINIPASILRVIRAFRVIRIFGRLKSLKNIIGALTASIIPVANAFLLVILVMGICAQQYTHMCTLARAHTHTHTHTHPYTYAQHSKLIFHIGSLYV